MFWVLLLMLSPLNVYSQEECGVPTQLQQNRVVVGSEATLGSFPWAASLVYCLEHEMPHCQTHRDYGWCSGTLINNRQVLTAAHCVRRNPAKQFVVNGVILGAVRLNETLFNGVYYDISEVLIHPNYEYVSPIPDNNDIALITLKYVVVYTDFIKPICLPTTPDLVANNFVGYHPFVAGWGTTNDLVGGIAYNRSQVLLYQQIPVVDQVTCQTYYTRVVRTTQICAGTVGNAACFGDSGSALLFPHLGRYYIIGIVSYGYSCKGFGNPTQPSVYTRITSYVDWITSNRVIPAPLYPEPANDYGRQYG